jgi:amidase
MTDQHIAWLGIQELTQLIRAGEISATEVTQAMLRRIEQIDPRLHAYARTTPELALTQAAEADARLARGEPVGPLHGVPIAVKDLCWTAGIPTAAGTTIHRDFMPPVDGTVVRRLREAGAVLLGKLQMTEGAYAAHHPAIVAPLNPWNVKSWTGVSSSGSGVAVAAGLCHGAIGTDTLGSIRFPSVANGVTGLKPAWGRVSRHGAFELAASMDHIGPMCRSAADCGLILGAIAGADQDDPTALQAPVPDYVVGDAQRLDGLRIGIDEADISRGVAPEVTDVLQEALRTLAALGAVPVPVTMPQVDTVVSRCIAHCSVEAAVAHSATFPSRRSEYGPVLAALLDSGLALSGTDYQRILLARAEFTGRMHALMQGVDMLLTPVMPFTVPSLAQLAELRTQPSFQLELLRYTAPFDMSGHPTITLPAGFTHERLPLGVQLVGAHLREELLVRAGRAFQNATDWHARRPPFE